MWPAWWVGGRPRAGGGGGVGAQVQLAIHYNLNDAEHAVAARCGGEHPACSRRRVGGTGTSVTSRVWFAQPGARPHPAMRKPRPTPPAFFGAGGHVWRLRGARHEQIGGGGDQRQAGGWWTHCVACMAALPHGMLPCRLSPPPPPGWLDPPPLPVTPIKTVGCIALSPLFPRSQVELDNYFSCPV